MKNPTRYLKSVFVGAQLLLLVLLSISVVRSQIGAVDSSFNSTPSREFPENQLSSVRLTIQPDGKTLVYGDNLIVGGAAQNRIVRFNQDGSPDASFNSTDNNFSISSATVLPDGKIILAGTIAVPTIGGFGGALVRRLNSDGTIDSTFTEFYIPPTFSPFQSRATVWAIRPDGKILMSVHETFSNQNTIRIHRLNPNGGSDSQFPVILFSFGSIVSGSFINKIALQTDGKFLVGSRGFLAGNAHSLRRYNPDGMPDSTFAGQDVRNPNTFAYINDFVVGADDSIIIAGSFQTINSTNRNNIAKLLPNGSLDTAFTSPLDTGDTVSRVAFAPNNQIIASTPSKFVRLNSNGAPDNSFNSSSDVTQIGAWDVDAAGRIVFAGRVVENGTPVYRLGRLNADGSLDASFRKSLGIPGSIGNLAIQTDGKIIAAGDFTQMNGIARRGLARLNADGSLDPTFDPGSGFTTFSGTSAFLNRIVVQPDGKILAVGGNFTSYNGTARSSIARLNADGTLDAAFNPNISSSIFDVGLQADGKIVITGSFNTVNGTARGGIARLNADGTLDAAFNPIFGGTGVFVGRVLVQTDGKLLVRGTFTTVNGVSRTNLARLNADGTLDAAFNSETFNISVRIQQQADGKYITSNGSTIRRLNNDGTVDGTFAAPSLSDGSINVILVQPNGGIIIGGSFTLTNQLRSRIARLNADGSLDASFVRGGANNIVFDIVEQPGGGVIVGGTFTSIGGVTRIGIARLSTTARRAAFDYDGDGRADVAVFRPANGSWYVLPSQTNSFYGFPFGQAGDQIAPADYDGDGKTDIAVFRDTVPGAGDKAYFYILNSADNSFRPVQFGATGDVPVSGDWDGDGKADLAVYRNGATNGQSFFYYRPSAQPTVDFVTIQLGTGGDKPVPADYDGDGRLDPAAFQPSSATWLILRSGSNTIIRTFFGLGTDIPVPADYDGDGLANLAVFRPSNGTWYTSQNPANNFGAIQFGANGDLPIAADYDGDGRADVAVFRPSNGAWYLNRTTNGFTGVQFGASGDKPAPNAFVR